MRKKVLCLDSEPDGLSEKLQAKKELQAKKLQAMKELQAKKAKTVLRRSPRLKWLRESNKQKTPTGEEFAERVLCDYNKKHGTELKFVRLLVGKDNWFLGMNYKTDFEMEVGMWKHFNFEVTCGGDADKPLVLFAEMMQKKTKYHLISLSLVPADETIGCPRCWDSVSHPRHGFRAGLFHEPNDFSQPKTYPKETAAQFSKFALRVYNKKHGTTIKFEKALKCIEFFGCGLTMDFSEKRTKWMHMNFEVRVGVGSDKHVERLFAELYLGDDGEYVLATLSPAEPPRIVATVEEWSMHFAGEKKWGEENYAGVEGCLFCPRDICHPLAFRFAPSPFED